MPIFCYYCNATIPSSQAKRCGRCRLVTYCSKDCQVFSWKASHKTNCVPNPTVAALKGAKPEKFSEEWLELEIDKTLSRWMRDWRRCLMQWTMIALDLPNHPPNRVHTHCLHMVVEPCHFQTKSYKNYSVVDAVVVSLTDIQEMYPELVMRVDTTDFTRLRYVVTLQNHKGEVRRVRLFQWNDGSIASWNKMPKESSAELANGATQALMYSMEHMAPDVAERNIGITGR